MFSMIIIFLLQLFVVPGNTTKTTSLRRLPEKSEPREYDGMFFYSPYNQLIKTFVITEKQKRIPSVSGSLRPTVRKPSGSNKTLSVLITVVIAATGITIGVLNFYGFELKDLRCMLCTIVSSFASFTILRFYYNH